MSDPKANAKLMWKVGGPARRLPPVNDLVASDSYEDMAHNIARVYTFYEHFELISF